MHKQGFTGAHVDSVYMSRGTENVLTMWTPFSDITPLVGTLAVCEGSNRLERYLLVDIQSAYAKPAEKYLVYRHVYTLHTLELFNVTVLCTATILVSEHFMILMVNWIWKLLV